MAPVIPPPPLSEQERQELERLATAATPGPWAWEWVAEKSNEWAVGEAWDANGVKVSGHIAGRPEDTIIERRLVGMNESGNAVAADAEFIAAARDALPRLLAEVRRLHAERAEMRAVLNRLACQHVLRSGGNDYMECHDCGLIWDYRKFNSHHKPYGGDAALAQACAYVAASSSPARAPKEPTR